MKPIFIISALLILLISCKEEKQNLVIKEYKIEEKNLSNDEFRKKLFLN